MANIDGSGRIIIDGSGRTINDEAYYNERSKLALERSQEIDPRIELKEMSKKVKEIL